MIYKKFKATVVRYGLLDKGDRVLVACSGGADSTALLVLLLELRQELALELRLAHFNHKLRPGADEDERFVRQVAARQGLPVVVASRNVRAFARRKGMNLEEAARELRYSFLKRAAARTGATKIATGHTLTDQAETVLMRILRGSGPRGLGGIAPFREGLIIRPLIEIERRQIEDFLRHRKLPFRTDKSNFDRRFLRNRIRLRLLPELARNYVPGIVRHLGRMASILREEDDLLEGLAGDLASKLVRFDAGPPVLDATSFCSLPRALSRRLVRRFIFLVKGDLRRVSFKDVEDILCLREGKEKTLPEKLVLRKESGRIFVKPKGKPAPTFERIWDGRGCLRLEEAGVRVSGKRLPKRPAFCFKYADNRRAYVDLSKLKFPLLVRSRKPGDEYRPLGAPGRKKLKEIMRARGIERLDRVSRPVFFSGGKIVWAQGCPVAEDFKVKRSTKSIFLIKITGGRSPRGHPSNADLSLGSRGKFL